MLYIVDTIISPIFHGEIIEAQRLSTGAAPNDPFCGHVLVAMGVMSSVARYLFSYGEGNFVRIVTTVTGNVTPKIADRTRFGQ